MKSVHCCKEGSRSRNEDSCFIDDIAGIYIISDGMGGHEDGHIASSIACQTASDTLLNDDPYKVVLDSQEIAEDDLFKQFVGYAVQRANIEVLKKTTQAQKDMGATITVVLVRNGKCYCAHIGDGRVYLVKDGKLSKVTTEHRAGKYVSRSLGEKKSVIPDLHVFDLPDDGAVLMCTDGFWDFVSEQNILDTIQKRQENEITQILYESALANGTDDNVTVVVIMGEKLQETKTLARIRSLENQVRSVPGPKEAWDNLISELSKYRMWQRLTDLVPQFLTVDRYNVEWLTAGVEACRQVRNKSLYIQLLEGLYELRPKLDHAKFDDVVKKLALAYCQGGKQTKQAREVCRCALAIEDNRQIKQFLNATECPKAMAPTVKSNTYKSNMRTAEHDKVLFDLSELRFDFIRLKHTLAVLAVVTTLFLSVAAFVWYRYKNGVDKVIIAALAPGVLGMLGLWLTAFGMTSGKMGRDTRSLPKLRHYGLIAAAIAMGTVLTILPIRDYFTGFLKQSSITDANNVAPTVNAGDNQTVTDDDNATGFDTVVVTVNPHADWAETDADDTNGTPTQSSGSNEITKILTPGAEKIAKSVDESVKKVAGDKKDDLTLNNSFQNETSDTSKKSNGQKVGDTNDSLSQSSDPNKEDIK